MSQAREIARDLRPLGEQLLRRHWYRDAECQLCLAVVHVLSKRRADLLDALDVALLVTAGPSEMTAGNQLGKQLVASFSGG